MKSLVLWVYQRLAYAFPHEFQMIYGADVVRTGEEAVEAISARHGFLGLLPLLADITLRLPVEYLAEMRRDLAYALRTLAKSRGFAAVGIISLGLGIGTAGVTAAEYFNMILRDLPGAQSPDQLVMVQSASYPYFEHYRDQRDLFTGAAAFKIAVPFNISLEGANAKAERVYGHLVSPEYFSVIGVNAARGRAFDPQVDRPGSASVVFISDHFWHDRMNADPDAVGRTIRVNGQTATIVGIGPKDFRGVMPYIPAEIFVPTTVSAAMAPELAGDVIHKRDAKSFAVLLRMAPGVTLESAEAGLDAITRHLDEESLDPGRNAKGRRVTLVPAGKVLPLPRQMRPVFLGMTLLLYGLILGIACMNLANMQLARATARRREVAVRLSVGASRFRLIRQLLTESVLLACIGGAVGILFAFWAGHAMQRMRLPFDFPVSFDFTPDWHVLLLSFAISLLAGIGFGLAPALASTRSDLASTLKEGAVAQTRGYRRFGMRNLLMAAQVAGSLMLLLIAGFLIIGFNKTGNIQVAFDANSMYLFSLDPVRDGYSAEQAANLFDHLPERLKQAPGVQQVTLSEGAPFSPQIGALTLTAPSDPGTPDQVISGVAKEIIGANYFESLSVTLLEGREFDSRDQRIDVSPGKAMPAVINETAAAAFFGRRDPLGRRLLDSSKSYEVVGVVKDLAAPMSQSTASGTAALAVLPVVYLPLTRSDFAHPPGGGMIVMIRSTHGTDTMAGIRHEMGALDPNLAMFNVRTLAEQIDQTQSYMRLNTWIYGLIGTFGLILAAIGLAGVTSYSVARRRKEIGIRMALGARKMQVLHLVMREGGGLVIAGTVLGFLGAVAAARVITASSSMFGPSFVAGMHDPRLLFGAPLLLAGLAMLACYVPARRSTKIDPLRALREE